MIVERYPNIKSEVGGLISRCEISSLLDINLLGGQVPLVLWPWTLGLLSPKNKYNKYVMITLTQLLSYMLWMKICSMTFSLETKVEIKWSKGLLDHELYFFICNGGIYHIHLDYMSLFIACHYYVYICFFP